MKRYWKLIGMTLAILLCIGTFYTRLAWSESRLPSFNLDTQVGTKKVLGDFVINGRFTNGSVGYTLKINQKGSQLLNENSMFTQLSNLMQPLEIQYLQKHDRSFMRGKNRNLDNFYVNQNKVVYASIESKNPNGLLPRDYQLEVAILDRKNATHPTTGFTLPISSNANSLNVNDVQWVGNQVKVVTTNFTSKGNEIHLYSVDVGKKKVVHDSTLFNIKENIAGNNQTLQLMTESDKTGPNNLVAVLVNTSKTYQPKLFIVNLISGNKTEIPLPKGFAQSTQEPGDSNREVVNMSGTKLVFLKMENQRLTVVPYDIMTRKKGPTFEILCDEKQRPIPITAIENNKLYILNGDQTVKNDYLIVKDLNTGKTLYKGKIKLEKGKLKSDQSYVGLDGIDVR